MILFVYILLMFLLFIVNPDYKKHDDTIIRFLDKRNMKCRKSKFEYENYIVFSITYCNNVGVTIGIFNEVFLIRKRLIRCCYKTKKK